MLILKFSGNICPALCAHPFALCVTLFTNSLTIKARIY